MFDIVGLDGQPLVPRPTVLIDPATGRPEKPPVVTRRRPTPYGGRRWARDQKLANRTRDDGRLTRKARKARTRLVRAARRMGMIPQAS